MRLLYTLPAASVVGNKQTRAPFRMHCVADHRPWSRRAGDGRSPEIPCLRNRDLGRTAANADSNPEQSRKLDESGLRSIGLPIEKARLLVTPPITDALLREVRPHESHQRL